MVAMYRKFLLVRTYKISNIDLTINLKYLILLFNLDNITYLYIYVTIRI